jgi:hypothetical protein
MFSKMQSSVYQNRGGSQHHAPSVNDVRFGGIDTKISVDQKLLPAPGPTLENAAAQEVIPPAMSTVTRTGSANLASWSSAFTYLMEGPRHRPIPGTIPGTGPSPGLQLFLRRPGGCRRPGCSGAD